jgi:hypothetical protein
MTYTYVPQYFPQHQLLKIWVGCNNAQLQLPLDGYIMSDVVQWD